MNPTYGEMFAGYGGLGMGVQSVLPGHMAWCAEVDPAPAKILAHHWPEVPNLGDVTKVDWDTVPRVDVLTGGFPCQDVSHAGKRLGLRPGTRTGLWSHMAYAIDKLRPSLVVAENVRGLLSAPADSDLEPCPWCVGDGERGALRALGAVLGDLADLRYDVWWCGLRAADVGAAHGRFRVFVFAQPADADLTGLEGRWAGGEREGERPAGPGGVEAGTDLTLLPTPAVNDMGTAYTPQQWDEWTARMRAEHGNGNGHGKSLAIEAQRLLPTPNTQNWKESGHYRDFGADLTHALMCGCEGGRSDSSQDDPGEELRDLWDADDPQALRQEARRLQRVHASPLLQPELRQHSPRGDEGRAALASPSTQGRPLPGVWDDDTAARPSHRPGPDEQRPDEPADALRFMPSSTPLARGPRCSYGCGEACGGHSPVAWGEYEAAIRRWEVRLGRPSPNPTQPGPKGGARLSAQFVEFLMGLPAGHVTGVPGLSRNDQLKALGNGVVPAQAAAATRAFLDFMAKGWAA